MANEIEKSEGEEKRASKLQKKRARQLRSAKDKKRRLGRRGKRVGGLAGGAAGQVGGTAAGAGVGAVGGAVSGGVGAIPGALLGAKTGASTGGRIGGRAGRYAGRKAGKLAGKQAGHAFSPSVIHRRRQLNQARRERQEARTRTKELKADEAFEDMVIRVSKKAALKVLGLAASQAASLALVLAPILLIGFIVVAPFVFMIIFVLFLSSPFA